MRRGFTLIELLVVLAVIGLLAGLTLPVVGGALEKGRRTREMGAARSLAQGYQLYATEHRGRLMPGYADDPAKDAEGRTIPHPVNARYPWRLAPYLDYDLEGVFLLESDQARREGEDFESLAYRVSVFPALGMNVFFVGGDMSGTSGQGLKPIPAHEEMFGRFCVTHVSQAAAPSRLLLFASARHSRAEASGTGYYKVTSPRFTGPRWASAWDPAAPAEQFGFVDLRWDRKAVAAMLDGSVRMLGETELRDMRVWADPAARADDPDWTLQRR